MKVMHESDEYKEYFEDVQGFYQDQEKKEEVVPVGKRLKEIREMQKMSLDQFAKISGIEPLTLRDIEDQKILPDLGTIVKLSKALRIGTSFLLGQESGYSYSVVRRKDRQNIRRFSTGTAERPNYQYQSLSSGIRDKHMETFLVTLTPDAGSAELSSHEGEEFIVVMEGTIRVVLGKKEETLEEGDSIYYLASVPHNVMNVSKKEKAVILAVIYTGR
ncbi:MAG: cupin domain-containing protein [Spirochaetes bacterium]|nr:cupin domain-containing protein [Spirochaetota bacterium]